MKAPGGNVRSIISNIHEKAGYASLKAASGLKASALFGILCVDVVVFVVNMLLPCGLEMSMRIAGGPDE